MLICFIVLPAQNILSLPVGFYFSQQDTINPDTEKTNVEKSSEFYDSLQIKADRFKWMKELHNIIIVPPKKSKSDTVETELLEKKYTQYSGLKIRNIKFVRLNPFGRSIEDTTYRKINWINNTGNALHVKTQERILRRQLLFNINDEIDPDRIADNERLIRQLSFIDDVRILISEDTDDKGYADVTIITRDVWSKAFFPEFKDFNAGKVELWDRNIFGTGNEFQNSIHWDPEKGNFWGYEAAYISKNIFGSFIDGRAFYQNVFEKESYGIIFDRKFFTPEVKYAGGLISYKMKTEKRIWFSDTLQILRPLNYNYSDAWVGRSFHLNSKNILDYRRLNLVFATRLLRYQFFTRPPEVNEDMLWEYHNRVLWLNSISLTAQSYYRSNLIYGYGRTEDIPNGWLVNTTIGREFSEFEDRNYVSLNLAVGNFIGPFGYLYTGLGLGGFINKTNSLEQGVFNLNVNYFTNLFILSNFKYRHFVNIRYVRGINRFPLERININDKHGIRGLSNNDIYGQQKLTLNSESVLFSPYNFYGFNFVFYGFIDYSIIGREEQTFNDLIAYTGFGFGVRIRNERLVFPTLQFRFSFYPGISSVYFEDHFKFSGEPKLNPRNFTTTAPQLLNFY